MQADAMLIYMFEFAMAATQSDETSETPTQSEIT